jgi:hypothetical protein
MTVVRNCSEYSTEKRATWNCRAVEGFELVIAITQMIPVERPFPLPRKQKSGSDIALTCEVCGGEGKVFISKLEES